MGCDGGTIPTRDELVRLKKKPEQKDKYAEMAARWKHCAISQEPLRSPIMACELGRLYNKESVLEFLLDKAKFECAENFDHLRGLKDVKELQLTSNPAYDKPSAEKGDGFVDNSTARHICPVTGLEMSGRYRFCYLFGCCCVLSERALKEVKSETCHKCGKPMKQEDIVVLNGTEEDIAEMRGKMEHRRSQAKLLKKLKKKAEAAEGSADGPSTSKQMKTEEKPESSKAVNGGLAHKSKLTNGTKAHTSKLSNGKTTEALKFKSIQENPNASKAFKSLFTSSDVCKNQPKAHWVTHNPQYY